MKHFNETHGHTKARGRAKPCGAEFNAGDKAAKYCGSRCREATHKRPERQCVECGLTHNKKTKTCSRLCHSAVASRNIKARAMARRRHGFRKDHNHALIVQALEAAGCQVLDVSDMGGGFPDLIVCRGLETLLVEIKNPETQYGRKGANKAQVEWAKRWRGPVYIISTLADVEEFVNGRPVRQILGEEVFA